MRILVFGNINGNFEQFHAKLQLILSKNGNFDLCICLGNFFGDNFDEEKWIEFAKKSKEFPIQVYALCPYSSKLNEFFQFNLKGCEVMPNLLILNNHGVYKEASGLKICYISDFSDKSEKFEGSLFEKVAFECLGSLGTGKNGTNQNLIDILITNCSPSYISNSSNDEFAAKADCITDNSKNLSILVKQIKPRYHFCYANFFAERNPYRNHTLLKEKAIFPTRFIYVADFANKGNEKSCYGLSIDPMSEMDEEKKLQEISKQLDLAGDNPYPEVALKLSQHAKRQYFYEESQNNSESKQPKQSLDRESIQQKCWFCLSNPDIERHLICLTLKNAYLVLPKGPVNQNHLLICPNTHQQCQASFDEETANDVQILKEYVKNMYAKVNLVSVFAERNLKSFHSTIECFGIQQSQIDRLEWVLVKELSKINVDHEEFPEKEPIKKHVVQNKPYYAIEFNSSLYIAKYLPKQFPLNFSRQLICSKRVLNAQSQLNWKECVLMKCDEVKMAEKIKSSLQCID